MNGFKKEIVNQIDDKIRLPYILYIPENMCNNARLIVRFLTPTIEEGNLNEILNARRFVTEKTASWNQQGSMKPFFQVLLYNEL